MRRSIGAYHPFCKSSVIWKSKYTYVPCSKSSFVTVGSSCRWNHVLYFLWYLHDCLFSSFAARYCWYVFCTIALKMRAQTTSKILRTEQKARKTYSYLLIIECIEQDICYIFTAQSIPESRIVNNLVLRLRVARRCHGRFPLQDIKDHHKKNELNNIIVDLEFSIVEWHGEENANKTVLGYSSSHVLSPWVEVVWSMKLPASASCKHDHAALQDLQQ